MQDSRKKTLIQINTVCNTSTGKIMGDIQREAIRCGYNTLSLVGRRKPFTDIPCEKYGNACSFWIHVIMNTLFDRQGFSSYCSTKRMIRRIRKEKPDIIHLHNLHGYYLHLPVLFKYLSEELDGKIFWTFHDCWPFTGHCAYFTMAGCYKWKTSCQHCPNKTNYPVSLVFDASAQNYADKQRMFGSLKDLTILTPSVWMKELVQSSFLSKYPVEVTPNGIDLNIFTYTADESIYDKYSIPREKKILLGVANVWDGRKGLSDIIELSQKLPSEYHIVLVGLSKEQIHKLPGNILGVTRTENQRELAALYSLAEIFINPSLEESFSLVTVEAFACGTPAIVLDTSAVKELITVENGIVLNQHDTSDYLQAIIQLESMNLNRETVAETAKKYDNRTTVANIVHMYEENQ